MLVLGLIFERPIFVSDFAYFFVLACPAQKYALAGTSVSREKSKKIVQKNVLNFLCSTGFFCGYFCYN